MKPQAVPLHQWSSSGKKTPPLKSSSEEKMTPSKSSSGKKTTPSKTSTGKKASPSKSKTSHGTSVIIPNLLVEGLIVNNKTLQSKAKLVVLLQLLPQQNVRNGPQMLICIQGTKNKGSF
jgi:hypothetical protein